MPKLYNISVIFTFDELDQLIPRTNEIIEIVGNEYFIGAGSMEDERDMDFSFPNEKAYRKAFSALVDQTEMLDYAVRVNAHIDQSKIKLTDNNVDEFYEKLKRIETDDSYNVQTTIEYAWQAYLHALELTDNPHHAAFILAHSAGVLVSEYDLDEDAIMNGYDIGKEIGSDENEEKIEENKITKTKIDNAISKVLMN